MIPFDQNDSLVGVLIILCTISLLQNHPRQKLKYKLGGTNKDIRFKGLDKPQDRWCDA